VVSLKYAVVERERRFLVARLPEGRRELLDVIAEVSQDERWTGAGLAR
jgi:hypothetical protein